MTCWRCASINELSVFQTTKAGTVRYICRKCRRELYHETQRRKGMSSFGQDFQPTKEWRDMAEESHRRVLERRT